MQTTPINQTPIVAGEPSKATLILADSNGNQFAKTFLIPPGAPTTLPSNIATTDQLAQFIQGNYQLSSGQVAGVGLTWDGNAGAPRFAYGNQELYQYSHILGTNSAGTYTCANGNSILQVQGDSAPVSIQKFTTTTTNASDVTFPHSFSVDNGVTVFFSPRVNNPHTGTARPYVCDVNDTPNRYGFNISIWSLRDNGWVSDNVTIDIIALGYTTYAQ